MGDQSDGRDARERGPCPTVGGVLAGYVAEHEVLCPNCDYPLKGLHDDVCPECGDPLELVLSASAPKRSALAVGMTPLILSTCYGAIFTAAVVWLPQEERRPINLLAVCVLASATASSAGMCLWAWHHSRRIRRQELRRIRVLARWAWAITTALWALVMWSLFHT